jgi:copper chaperone CopZ
VVAHALIALRKALEKVPGVTPVEVDFAITRVKKIFDQAEASVDTLTKAAPTLTIGPLSCRSGDEYSRVEFHYH